MKPPPVYRSKAAFRNLRGDAERAKFQRLLTAKLKRLKRRSDELFTPAQSPVSRRP